MSWACLELGVGQLVSPSSQFQSWGCNSRCPERYRQGVWVEIGCGQSGHRVGSSRFCVQAKYGHHPPASCTSLKDTAMQWLNFVVVGFSPKSPHFPVRSIVSQKLPEKGGHLAWGQAAPSELEAYTPPPTLCSWSNQDGGKWRGLPS